MLKYILIINFFIFISPLPVAILHGFYDTCDNQVYPNLINIIVYNIGNYATCIRSGEGPDSLSMTFQEQAEKACEEINNDPNFMNDFSILSISQGGLLARYIIQKCKMKGIVKKLVSFGGPMMGTSKVPFCLNGVICYIINSLVDYFVYGNWAQSSIGPAGYYRTSPHIKEYKKSESFLVQLNNEGKDFDQESKDRFCKLERLILIGFKKDKMIAPKESAEFCEYDEKFNLVHMNQTNAYLNDLFGLKTLDEKKNVIEVHYIDRGHIQFDYDDLLKYAIPNL